MWWGLLSTPIKVMAHSFKGSPTQGLWNLLLETLHIAFNERREGERFFYGSGLDKVNIFAGPSSVGQSDSPTYFVREAGKDSLAIYPEGK